MLPYKLSLEVTSYASLIIGFFALFQNRHARVNQLFFVFSMLVATYTHFLVVESFSANQAAALAVSRIMYIGVILIPSVYYHLTLSVIGRSSKLLLPIYLIGAFFLAFLPTNYFIPGVRYFTEFKIYSQMPGVLYIPFLVYFFGVIGYALLLAFKKYRASRGLEKIQLGYFVYGSAIGFIGGSLDYLPKFGIYIHPLNTYCNFLIGIYLALFAYAIVKYRLMDIRVIVRKGLIYSVLIAISTALYLFAIYALSQVLQVRVRYNPLWIGGGIIIIFAFIFQPLKSRVQDFIDKRFFKSKYSYQNMLKHLSQFTVSVIDLDVLLQMIGRQVTDIMKLEGTSVMIFDKQANSYALKNEFHKGGEENAGRS